MSYYDDYYSNEENLYSNAFHTDTKQDSGATTFPKKIRRIPLHKLTETDEIPEMPQVVVEKPNDAHYTKLIKEVEDTVAKHYKSIEEINLKIENEKYGNNPERTSLFEQRKKLVDVLKPTNDELFELNHKMNPVKDDMSYYRGERESIQKEIDFKDITKLNKEIL